MKLVEYLLEMDCKPVIPALGNVVNDYESVQSIFKQTLVQEKTVSQSIHRIIEMATQTNDHATNNFLQWYVAEQREEESMIRKIIDKIELIGNGPQSLYYIDKEMDRFNQAIIKNIEGEKGK
jgi:ferritin